MIYKYFGTDGIRGKVGVTPITADFFLKLGWAIGRVLLEESSSSKIIIGKDTRVSGYMFESALEAGILSSGVDVILLGPIPTPAVSYLTKAYAATVGAIISASHNSYKDNGIKFFSRDGFKLDDSYQYKIEAMLSKYSDDTAIEKIGKARRADQAEGRYIEFCKSTYAKELSLNTLKIVIDCANGATYRIAPYVFRELDANVISINDKPDGFNINKRCGSTCVGSLQKTVLAQNTDIGIAFDGDGDRVIMVDKNGKVVDGDELLFIIAKYWHAKGILKNNAVVGTKMTNLGVLKSLNNIGIKFYEADVGDRFVLEKMIEHKVILGGEGSGTHSVLKPNSLWRRHYISITGTKGYSKILKHR